ncbi:MAG: SIS domain-containing protein [Bacteroidales bacterium]
MNKDLLKKGIEDSIRTKERILLDDSLLQKLLEAIILCTTSLQKEGCVFFCGNGGSAADAQHLAAELTGRYYYDRPPLNAEALHVDTSYLTAVANDYSYDEIYARMIRGKAHRGDVLVGISTSGNSNNVCRALSTAKEMGLSTISLTGDGGGKMQKLGDIWIGVPSTDTPRIQESHILMGHLLCQGIEEILFPREK